MKEKEVAEVRSSKNDGVMDVFDIPGQLDESETDASCRKRAMSSDEGQYSSYVIGSSTNPSTTSYLFLTKSSIRRSSLRALKRIMGN